MSSTRFARHCWPWPPPAGRAGAAPQEAVIRKNLAERLPNFPKIDEVSKTPIPGLYEVRIGTEILYTDEQGNHLIEGQRDRHPHARQPDRRRASTS